MEPMGDAEARVRTVTVVVLGVNLLGALIGLTFAAVLTDRELLAPELMTLAAALAIATIGGLPQHWWHRRGRWKIEHDHEDGIGGDTT